MKALIVLCLLAVSFSASAAYRHATPQHLRTQVYTKHKSLSLDAQASIAMIPNVPLYCEFSASGQPRSWAIFDPHTARVWIRSGYPKQTVMYSNVTIQVGNRPYGDGGFTVVAFGDVPVFSALLKNRSICPLISFAQDIFDSGLHATWANLPGGPKGIINAGYCGVGRPALLEDHDFVGW